MNFQHIYHQLEKNKISINNMEIGTVDGSEIRRLPVEVGSLSHYLQCFSTIPGG